MNRNQKGTILALLILGVFFIYQSNMFSLFYEIQPTTLNVGEKVYYRVQVWEDGGGSYGGSKSHDVNSEIKIFQALKSGTQCWAEQKIFKSGEGSSIDIGSRHNFDLNMKHSSAAGNYYELVDGSLWFTRYEPNTVEAIVYVGCGNNYYELDASKDFTFVSSGGTTIPAACNPTDCNAKGTSFCNQNLLYTTTYGCIEGQCVKRDSSYIQNTECNEKYQTSLCINYGKVWNGNECVIDKSQTSQTNNAINIADKENSGTGTNDVKGSVTKCDKTVWSVSKESQCVDNKKIVLSKSECGDTKEEIKSCNSTDEEFWNINNPLVIILAVMSGLLVILLVLVIGKVIK